MKTPKICLALYLIVLIWSGIAPVDRGVWVVEALTSLVPVIILAILYWRKLYLSPLGYILAAVFPIMHAIGAHYTFAEVPFAWFNNLFGFERNMYDRVAHATVGLYALPIVEFALRRKVSSSVLFVASYALFAIMALAAAYELFEWQYAVLGDPAAGIAVLGAQGDIWDAQKDMLMDTLGAVIGIVIFFIARMCGIYKKNSI